MKKETARSSQTDYAKLHQISREARVFQGISSVLNWDQETYMPLGADAIRSEQFKELAGLIHQKRTSKRFQSALNKLIDISSGDIVANDLSAEQIAALKCWRRDYLQEVSLPKRFVEELSHLTSHTVNVWRNARKANDFKLLAPHLKKIIQLSRKKADYLGYQDHPYDALIDLYEPHMTTKSIQSLFDPLRTSLSSLVKQVVNKQNASGGLENHFLFSNFSTEQQLAFSSRLLDDMGYDLTKGRLDLSTHPFSSASHPTDSRITTRIHATGLMSNISAVLHEAGHGLYEMGLLSEHYGSPLCEAISFGFHESQSRWWETLIGLSRPFWQYYFPILQNYFKGQLNSVSFEQFYQAINKVEPSLIRIESDELTYPLHIIVRFELEKQLIEGTLAVKDIPQAWNEKMQELLGVTPKTDAEGCLQDIHWSCGYFGYFPSYALGNMYAAHLFEGFQRDCPDWQTRISSGQLIFVTEWLRKHVYQHGRRYSSLELLQQVSKKPFTSEAYLGYLSNKYHTT